MIHLPRAPPLPDGASLTFMLAVTGVEIDNGVVSFLTASGHVFIVNRDKSMELELADGTPVLTAVTSAQATSKAA